MSETTAGLDVRTHPHETVQRKRLQPAKIVPRILLYTLVILLSILFALPFIWMVSTSLKDDPQTFRVPPIWLPNPMRFANYPEALTKYPFGQYFVNTLWYAIPSTVGSILSSAIVAYGFSRIRWRGRNLIFFVCLTTIMIPFQVRFIPLYIIFKNLHWLNSYKPLIVPAFFGNVYYIFLLRQFFMSIPHELSEAAKIDGASEWSVLTKIILPLAKPALAVVGLFQFIGAWNDYLGPLIYLNRSNLFPISLGLENFNSAFAESLRWPYTMAASTVTILPIVILFFVAQRTFVEGVTVTGIKG
ncbi:MAG TPA: carbohydrate ABC transporter permease [Herpetosiphonaceae bacterium]|nr:carbohydrate ABC transporter permease [Herpetosiphonaceae bacterium]